MAEVGTPPEVFATSEAQVQVEDHGQSVHVEPEAFGLQPYQWVAVAMLILLIFAFVGAKVHRAIFGGLDNKIASIRSQLDEAKKLRAEAEALKVEYQAKIAGAEKDAEAMLENARREADAIVAKAEEDTTATIARRKQMAEDKIAAAERAAIADVKAKAANAATAASRELIAAKHDAAADQKLADELIASI